MNAYIAIGEGTQDRVGKRVQGNVGIGMAGERVRMPDPDSSEHYVVARTERMNIETGARAHVAERSRLRRFRTRKVLRRRELHIAGLAREHADGQAGPLGESGIVGKIVAALRGRATMCREQGVEREGLGRLHQTQRAPVKRCLDRAILAQTFNGIRYRQYGDRRAGLFGCRNCPRYQVGARERPRSVVHKHDGRRTRRKCLKPRPNRCLPGRAAKNGRQNSDIARFLAHEFGIVGPHDRLHGIDRRNRCEPQQGAPEQGLTADLAKLLWHVAARAQALTGGDNNNSDP
jgi:hypothetical protein